MKNFRRAHSWLLLLGSILLAQGAGALGTLATIPAIPTWYATLNKPFFNPPNWLFGPVWTILYTLMAISAYLVWKEAGYGQKTRQFFRFYFFQLALNSLWSLIFFGAKSPLIAFFVILLLLRYIFLSLRLAKPFSPVASYLFYPYLAWVIFASLLNLAIVVLN